MSTPTVLLLGGTGRTGGQVLRQLLERGVHVRAIVRDPRGLPDGVAGSELLSVVTADLLAMPDADLRDRLRGCQAVISCLGHTISLRGVFGPPRDLVEQAVRRISSAAADLAPARPVRLVLMSSVSVNGPGRAGTTRGAGQRAFLWTVRQLVPPARDNQRAADYLVGEVGTSHRHLEWVAVRPDTLKDGDPSPYDVVPQPTASLFRPDETRIANAAHFMVELATDPPTWQRWRFQLPAVTDARR